MTLASPLWNKLSVEEKDIFTQLAKQSRAKDANNPGGVAGPMDSLGRSLLSVKRRDEEEMSAAKKKIQVVDDILSREAANLEDSIFYVMHSNIFVKSDMDGVIVPAEICFSKFSLRGGLLDVYQCFPVPDPPGSPIPLTYTWACRLQSDKLQIPLEFEHSAVTTGDMGVLSEILRFLGGTKWIFTMPECEEVCSGVLTRIAQRSGQPSLGLSFLSLPLLFFRLWTARCETEEEMMATCLSDRVALAELERERFL